MKRMEVIADAKRIQAVAHRGAGRKFPVPAWAELADEQRAALLAVARWHRRRMKEASKTYWYSP